METTDTGALIQGIKENTKTEVIKLTSPDGKTIEVIAHSNGDEGVSLTGTKAFFDAYRKTPENIRGSALLADVDSFIAHAGKFFDTNSVFFADRTMLKLTMVYDYHVKGAPQNMYHLAIFAPKTARQLVTWKGGNGSTMNQATFAAFIENNILDLCEASDDATEIAAKLGTTIATPSKLLELARGLSIHEAASVKSHMNTSTGEVTLEYITAHSDGSGKKIQLPGLFTIGVPVFENGKLYRILARLRYRITEGKASYWYELYQLEDSIDHAFEEVIEKVKDETALPMFRGAAEV